LHGELHVDIFQVDLDVAVVVDTRVLSVLSVVVCITGPVDGLVFRGVDCCFVFRVHVFGFIRRAPETAIEEDCHDSCSDQGAYRIFDVRVVVVQVLDDIVSLLECKEPIIQHLAQTPEDCGERACQDTG